MTYPRSHLVDPNGGVYHVYSRCVRRAYLCGQDPVTSYNFDHRKDWIEHRILQLAGIFTIDVFGYAVMSNHYHIVLNVTPNKTRAMTDDEIVNRWLSLSSSKRLSEDRDYRQYRFDAIVSNPSRVLEIRSRLSSLSWFMRFLNEPLARIANAEDDCKGRFWEGRFKSQRLLDENALLACMVYVDLNPVRAGIVKDPTKAAHTSLSRRCRAGAMQLNALNVGSAKLPLNLTLGAYIALANWIASGRGSRNPRSHKDDPPIDLPPDWLTQYTPVPGSWQRALGSVERLKAYARELGQHWVKSRSLVSAS